MTILRLVVASFIIFGVVDSTQAQGLVLDTSVTICCVETVGSGDTAVDFYFLVHGDTYQEAKDACFASCEGEANSTCAVASIQQCNGGGTTRPELNRLEYLDRQTRIRK